MSHPAHVHDVPETFKKRALVGAHRYEEMYARSLRDPDAFWGEQGQIIDWVKPYSRVKNTSFAPGAVSIEWFGDGTTNVSTNCIDRHLAEKGDKVAILWEGDDPKDSRRVTYRELHVEVCRFANVLKAKGVGKGDRVTIYMPMVPEAAFAMLACARIGAVHSVVFGGFSPEALAGRITGCDSKIVVTADEAVRGGRTIPLKKNVDAAVEKAGIVEHVVVVKRTGAAVAMTAGRDVYYDEAARKVGEDCPAEEMAAEAPLFILYTSGSTGQPKG
ncbi:MAG: AMP-binding protein, partial [Janthinobacterium lividum]